MQDGPYVQADRLHRTEGPFDLGEIGSERRGRKFAIRIDEAHSSQGGKTSAAVSGALTEGGAQEKDETPEGRINRIMEARKLLLSASYYKLTTAARSAKPCNEKGALAQTYNSPSA